MPPIFLLVILLVGSLFVSVTINDCTLDSLDSINRYNIHDYASKSTSEFAIPSWSHDIEGAWSTSMISADGSTCVVAEQDTVSVIDTQTNTTLWKYNTSSWILTVSISDNGSLISVGTVETQKVYLFGRESNTTLWKYDCIGYVIEVEVSGDGTTIGAVDFSGGIYLFDHSSNETLWEYADIDGLYSISLSKNGSTIVAGGRTNTIYVFERTSNSTLWTYAADSWILGTSMSSNGVRIAIASITELFVFERTNNVSLWSYKSNGFVQVAISKDGSMIAAGTDATTHPINMYVFEFASNTTLWTLNVTNQIREIDFSYDGSRLAAGGYGNITYLFDKSSNQSLLSFETPGYIHSVSLSADGRFLMTAGGGGSYLFNFVPPTISSVNSVSPYYNTTSSVRVQSQINKGSLSLAQAIAYYSTDNTTWFTTSMVNKTNLSEQILLFETSLGLFQEGLVYFYCHFNNTFGDYTVSQIETIIIDGSGPSITLNSVTPSSPTSSDSDDVIWSRSFIGLCYRFHLGCH